MKDILREPILYYLLIPAVLIFWPLVVWLHYLPKTQDNWNNAEKLYSSSLMLMDKILKIDSARLDYADSKKSTEFDYTVAVDNAARRVEIPSAGYTLSSKPVRTTEGQKTQDCQIVIQQTDITRFTKFLSTLQFTWADLQCEKVALTKKKGLADAWQIDLTLKYYY